MLELERTNEYTAQTECSEKETFESCPDKLKVGLDLGTAYIVLVVLDAKDRLIACEKRATSVPRDSMIVDHVEARRTVREPKEKPEAHLGQSLERCAIAMPAGTDSNLKTHTHVVESVRMQVINALDEPIAANTVYRVSGRIVADIGGGITGFAVLKGGKVVQIEDEPIGGTHLTLVLAGSYQIPIVGAEAVKLDSSRYAEIFPAVKAVIEKMAAIVKKYVSKETISAIYPCGGTCCLAGVESVFEKETGIPTYKPENPFLVTPAGIAMNCIEKQPLNGSGRSFLRWSEK